MRNRRLTDLENHLNELGILPIILPGVMESWISTPSSYILALLILQLEALED